MPEFLTYYLKLSVALPIVYLFYVVALRRLTFYNWNRWYLLLYTGLCFLFPLIDIGSLFSSTTGASSSMIAFVPTLSDFNKHMDVSNTATSFFTLRNAIAAVLLGGMFFLFGRLLIQLYSYNRMAKKARLVSVKGIQVYETDLSTLPFSFGRSVFINTQQHTEEELAEIIKHEFVHVKQMHTIDVLWGELLCIVNWCNPFAWLIRNAIRQNLEFIADDRVLQEGIDKTQYQYLLLKVTGNKQYSIAPSFNFSSLKKRIAMMNKSKTAKLQLMRFLFLLPVVVVLLLVFRKRNGSDAKSDSHMVTNTEYIEFNHKIYKNIESLPLHVVPSSNVHVKEVIGDLSANGFSKISNSLLKDTTAIEYINAKGNIIMILQNKVVVVLDKSRKVREAVFLVEWVLNKEHYTNLYGPIPDIEITRTDLPQVRQYFLQMLMKEIALADQKRNKIAQK